MSYLFTKFSVPQLVNKNKYVYYLIKDEEPVDKM